jgi:hypothetical protein
LKTKTGVLSTMTAMALTALTVAPVSAAPVVSDPIATGFAGPTQLHVADDGDVYVADEFVGTVTKVTPQGGTSVVVREKNGTDLGGVSVSARGTITYGVSGATAGGSPYGQLKQKGPHGKTRVLAKLLKFESTHNPDAGNRYGFLNVSKKCAAKLPQGVAPYKGIVESHPYAVTKAPGGGWYVADAAGNDVLKVSPKGKISVAFLGKPQKVIATKAAVEANNLPACTIGKTYAAEPVPTDVEVSKSGTLYISQLPGGPEDPSLGARGKIMRVSAKSHRVTTVARHLAGATNIALSGRSIYVTELFGGGIAKVTKATGKVAHFLDLSNAVSIEKAGGKLYVGRLGDQGSGTPGTVHIITP